MALSHAHQDGSATAPHHGSASAIQTAIVNVLVTFLNIFVPIVITISQTAA